MENTKPIYTLWCDKPNGGTIVECSVCEGHFDIENSTQTEHQCPHCKTELQYPEYASW